MDPYDRTDAASCKEGGNACMSVGDYVNAMKWYSQALAAAPRDAALYSNRSFAFLKLGLTARALADADEAIRRRPDWAKAHFRRAEALSRAGVHEEALQAYAQGAKLDPSDEHLQKSCADATARLAARKRAEYLQVAVGGAVGLAVLALLLLAPASEAAPPKPGTPKPPSGALAGLWSALGLLLGALVGAAAGAGAVMLRRHQRKGTTLAPLQSNEHFAAMQMQGDADGAGPLRSKVLERPPEGPAAAAAAVAPPPGAPAGGGGGGNKPEGGGGGKGSKHVRSTQNGRAAALRAMGKGK